MTAYSMDSGFIDCTSTVIVEHVLNVSLST